jgi:FMN-dependent NADH-azoreductase
MWNFAIPYALKYCIDAIIQPGYLFKYNEQGQAIGLVRGKKMVCINAQPMDVTLQLREAATTAAIEQARSLAANSEWNVVTTAAGMENPPELKPHSLLVSEKPSA